MHPTEVRRAPRFRVALRVQIAGFDSAPVLRDGDVSASGLYMQLDRDVGEVGSMQRLSLATVDGSCAVVVLSRIVRVATVDDFWKGRCVTGIAFEFLFSEEQGSEPGRTVTLPVRRCEAVQRLLRAAAEHHARRQGLEVRNWRGTVHTPEGEQAAGLSELSLRGMAIETDYPVAPGQTIRVEMPGRTQDSRLSFDGHVVECAPLARDEGLPARFRVVVRFGALPEPREPDGSASGDSMDDAFDTLMGAFTSLVPPAGVAEAEPVRHLAGALSRISVMSVLTLCQIERTTGVLLLTSGTSKVRAFLRDGELIDATVDGRDVPPRGVLREVVGWTDGSFEMSFEAVTRSDRLNLSTTVLLIDLSRELDELSQV